MKCPKCGKELNQTSRALGCSGWRDGCDFAIWNTVAGHELTMDEKEQLVENGITKKEITDFVSRAGNNFSARLKLDEDKKVSFQFEERETKTHIDNSIKCPTCGSPIRIGEKAWSCTNKACNVVIFNHIAAHELTDEEKKTLLQGKEIGPFEFISKAGKPFTARVGLKNDGRPGFVFEERKEEQKQEVKTDEYNEDDIPFM